MAVLYLMRHGQTQFNAEGRVQGWKDSPLTEEGVRQAEAMKKWFEEKNIHFKAAYASDLPRAVHTMQLACPDDCPMYAVHDLREISFGDMDGKYGWELDEAGYRNDPEKFGGESVEKAMARARNALTTIASREHEHHCGVLVTAHSGILYFLYPLLDKAEGTDWPAEMEVPNGTVFEVDGNGDYLVLKGVRHPDGTVWGTIGPAENE